MLQVTIPPGELYDEKNNEFINTKEQTLQLEHSLVSLSKWESKWHKPFLTRDEKTRKEIIDYIRCMTITQNVDPDVYHFITDDIIQKVSKYIEDSMTATTFTDDNTGPRNREIKTAEVIYYYMISLNIPFECQKWHLNRLFALINVCNKKNAPSKKMGMKDIYSQNKALNAARRNRLHTKG